MITTATRQWVERKKYSFEALTAMSMLEPAEKNVIYGILLLLLIMLIYTVVMYLPTHVVHLVRFFSF